MALDTELAQVLRAALADEGHTAQWISFGPDAVRLLAHYALDVLVFDGHEYVNTKHFLAAVRAQRGTATLQVVVLGPARPDQVPQLPGTILLGRAYDLYTILDAVADALRR
jgi:DNA-binding response OmpR family regulator